MPPTPRPTPTPRMAAHDTVHHAAISPAYGGGSSNKAVMGQSQMAGRQVKMGGAAVASNKNSIGGARSLAVGRGTGTAAASQQQQSSYNNNSGRVGAGMGTSMGGMSGTGGMGMGMGMMGGMNSLMMMGAMGGMGGGMMGSGPMSWIYSLNYFVTSVGHMASVVGMNSQALLAAYHNAYVSVNNLILRVRTSEMRRILQRKCRRSRLFRFLFVMACSAVVGTALKVVHSYWDYLTRARLPYSPSGYGSGYGAGAGGYGGGGVGGAYGGSYLQNNFGAYGGTGYGAGAGQRAVVPAIQDL